MKLPNNLKNLKNLIKLENNTQAIYYIILVIIIILIVITALWIQDKLTLNKRNCLNISKTYPNFAKVSSIYSKDTSFSYNLRDYYIKTAYNCCAGGKYKNDFVNLCALKNAIKQGARALDFEIYSVNNKPVVAVSSVDEYSIKQSYNSIPFEDVLKTISDYAFSSGTSPNPDDPLILHFRIKSNNIKIYNLMANAIYKNLENKILGKEYSYEYGGKNLGAVPIKKFVGKAIIVVDKSNPLFESTDLEEYINITSNSVFMRAYRFNNIVNTHNMNELINYNKKNMMITIPNLSSSNDNYSANLCMKYGCQFIGMSFQNLDTNMEFYNKIFENDHHAFVLKPETLRFIPVTIEKPAPPPKEYSFGPREVSSDFYNFKV